MGLSLAAKHSPPGDRVTLTHGHVKHTPGTTEEERKEARERAWEDSGTVQSVVLCLSVVAKAHCGQWAQLAEPVLTPVWEVLAVAVLLPSGQRVQVVGAAAVVDHVGLEAGVKTGLGWVRREHRHGWDILPSVCRGRDPESLVAARGGQVSQRVEWGT